MPVQAKPATDRRSLRFESLQEALDDADEMAVRPHHMLGRWSLGQVCEHLARTIDASIDGFDSSWPRIVQVAVGPFARRLILHNALPAGFQIPASMRDQLVPGDVDTADALDRFARSIARTRKSRCEQPHPVFGPMNHGEWMQLHCRHAELHLSFAVRSY